MFLDFYQLVDQPFGVTPDPRYLYLSRTHREALASLFYSIASERGFMTLIAPPGMGKTTLLYQLMERLRPTTRMAFLFQTQCDSTDLMRYLLADLGCGTPGQDVVVMHAQLKEILVRESQMSRRVVLIIDEAQNLSDSVLETVRLLSDYETPDRKYMQIILAGQPQLAETLERPALSQLRQRISSWSGLVPFTPSESNEYIDYRLQASGYRGGPLFTPQARALIAAESAGIPRNINSLCFNALSLGFAKKQRKIDAEIVEEVIRDLKMETSPPKYGESLPEHTNTTTESMPSLAQYRGTQQWSMARRRFVLSVGLVVMLVLVGIWGFRFRARFVDKTVRAHAGQSSSAAPAPKSLVIAAQPGNALASPTAPPVEDKSSASQAGRSISSPPEFVTVMPAETLNSICLNYLGRYDNRLRDEILKLNPHLESPDRILAGQHIKLPHPLKKEKKNDPATTGHSASPAPDSPLDQKVLPGNAKEIGSGKLLTVAVEPDQTLKQICLHYLGRYDEKLKEEIWSLNPHIENPDRILVGQRIQLPSPTLEAQERVGAEGQTDKPATSQRKTP
jgi:general secretion pathway protein A